MKRFVSIFCGLCFIVVLAGIAIAAKNTSGDLDTTFGGTGTVTTSIGNGAESRGIALQTDGKIVVAGTSQGAFNYYDFALARYNTDGSLDTTFGGTGKVTTEVSSYYNDEANAVAIQSDGKIVAAGKTLTNIADEDFALVRYNTDGSLDATFGSNGIVTTAIGNNNAPDGAYAVAVQNDGKIIAAGLTDLLGNGVIYVALVRYNTDGTLDTTFGGTGFATPATGYAKAVAIQDDGKIVTAGTSASSFFIARYNADGNLDTAFGTGGMVTTAVGISSFANCLVLQTDGKIVAIGQAYNGSIRNIALVRYNTDGSLDTTFGGAGVVTTSFGDARGNSGAVQSDGKIIAAGQSSNAFTLVRYDTNGILDTTFGKVGKVTTSFGQNYINWVYGIALQNDGKIVATGLGWHSNPIGGEFALARYLP